MKTTSERRVPSPILIRKMTRRDTPAVAAIERESNHPAWSARMFERELELPISLPLAAFLPPEPEPAGFAVVWVVAGGAQLLEIAVRAGCRRRGVAGALLEEAMAAAQAQGAKKMELELKKDNAAARALYEKFGFRAAGVRKNFYPDSDALLMERPL